MDKENNSIPSFVSLPTTVLSQYPTSTTATKQYNWSIEDLMCTEEMTPAAEPLKVEDIGEGNRGKILGFR